MRTTTHNSICLSGLSPQCGDNPKAVVRRGCEIVAALPRQFSTHCVEIVSALRTQTEQRVDGSKILHAWAQNVAAVRRQSQTDRVNARIVQSTIAQSESEFLSLTPGFSQVTDAGKMDKPFQRFIRTGSKPLKRFARHAVANTRLKLGVNERLRCDVRVFRDLCGTTALTPALSPRRGRTVRRCFERREAEITRSTFGKDEDADRCSLSLGERVRASVKTNFLERNGINGASYLTKLIPKRRLEQKLHEAVPMARARLEREKL